MPAFQSKANSSALSSRVVKIERRGSNDSRNNLVVGRTTHGRASTAHSIFPKSQLSSCLAAFTRCRRHRRRRRRGRKGRVSRSRLLSHSAAPSECTGGSKWKWALCLKYYLDLSRACVRPDTKKTCILTTIKKPDYVRTLCIVIFCGQCTNSHRQRTKGSRSVADCNGKNIHGMIVGEEQKVC